MLPHSEKFPLAFFEVQSSPHTTWPVLTLCYYLSVWLCLSGKSDKWYSIPYGFCNWLHSCSIMLLRCTHGFGETVIYSFNFWIVSIVWTLYILVVGLAIDRHLDSFQFWIISLWTIEYKSLYGHKLLFLLGKYSGVKLLATW